MVIGMLHAEKQTRKTKNISWSPKFAQAVNIKTFWKIVLSQRLTHTRPSDKFHTWSISLGTQDFNTINIIEVKKDYDNHKKTSEKLKNKPMN
jgi:hypothetical protein